MKSRVGWETQLLIYPLVPAFLANSPGTFHPPFTVQQGSSARFGLESGGPRRTEDRGGIRSHTCVPGSSRERCDFPAPQDWADICPSAVSLRSTAAKTLFLPVRPQERGERLEQRVLSGVRIETRSAVYKASASPTLPSLWPLGAPVCSPPTHVCGEILSRVRSSP